MGLLITILIRSLEAMFAAGWLGSVFVLLITAVEDVETLTEFDEPSDR